VPDEPEKIRVSLDEECIYCGDNRGDWDRLYDAVKQLHKSEKAKKRKRSEDSDDETSNPADEDGVSDSDSCFDDSDSFLRLQRKLETECEYLSATEQHDRIPRGDIRLIAVITITSREV
jgi:hypothetical protein